MVDTEKEGLGTQYLEANTELRHLAFLQAGSAVLPLEVSERMEGEHTPEVDLTRHHQVLEEGESLNVHS